MYSVCVVFASIGPDDICNPTENFSLLWELPFWTTAVYIPEEKSGVP